jgi:hypothetical protein
MEFVRENGVDLWSGGNKYPSMFHFKQEHGWID